MQLPIANRDTRHGTQSLRMFHSECRHTAPGEFLMSIRTISKALFSALTLTIALAGASWAGDTEQKDAGETASVDAAPPAAEADEDATAEKAEAADNEEAEAASD
jgi:hypothetical protein